MSVPATARPRPALHPLTGAAWFAARLSLAVRRTRGILRWWLSLGGALAVIALLLPVAPDDPAAAARATLERAAADSLRTGARLAQFREAAAAADSQRPAAADPRARALATAIDGATAAGSVEALLGVSNQEAVRYGPRRRALADSLRTAADEATRTRIGSTILSVADYRRRELEDASQRNVQAASAVVDAGPDTLALHRDAERLADSVRAAFARHEAARTAVATATAGLEAGRQQVPPVSPGLVVLGVVLLGVVVRVSTALASELRLPTLAHVGEAEASVGAPVLSWVRDPLPQGPLRFRPRGVDPFRVLYLGLTATGTRSRSVLVVTEDSIMAAAVAARLAVAAAADHRSTLVVDVDTDQMPLARIFGDHPEPGFSDASAGNLTWAEVARPVGSSDGLALTMIPAGTTHADQVAEEIQARTQAAFVAFAERYEFTILAVASHDLARARALLPAAPLVLCGVVGSTSVEEFTTAGSRIQARGDRIHSVVLWDAPRPTLPSRAELAAQLSKRKGRAQGVSLIAPNKAINKPSSGQ